MTNLEVKINDLKNQLYTKVDRYKHDLSNVDLQNDILNLIDKINVLEVEEYGYKITDEWGL